MGKQKLVVFGSTGQTGLAVLAQSCADSQLEVTAFLRSPKKVPENIRSRIHVIVGDVLNADQVSDAIEGKHAVISCLGVPVNFGSSTVISRGTANIVNGMKTQGVQELRVVGGAALLPNQFIPFPISLIVADMKRMFEGLKKSDVNWICIATPNILNDSITGTSRATINKITSNSVTTHDMAEWMLLSVKDPSLSRDYSRQLVGVCSKIGWKTWLTKTPVGKTTAIALVLLAGGSVLTYRYLSK